MLNTVNYFLLVDVLPEPLNRMPHSQVSNTAFHQSSDPARAPDATAAGNTIGMTAGQIQYTIVPPDSATPATISKPVIMAPNAIIILSINFCL